MKSKKIAVSILKWLISKKTNFCLNFLKTLRLKLKYHLAIETVIEISIPKELIKLTVILHVFIYYPDL